MSRFASPRNIILLLAVTSLLTAGIVYALIQVTREVSATVTVLMKVPDGIEVYSNENLTQVVNQLDFGEVVVDKFGTIIQPPTIPLWIKNRSSSTIELDLADDFNIGDVLIGVDGGDLRLAFGQREFLEPEAVLPVEVGLRFSEQVQGDHDFIVSFIGEGPIIATPTPPPTPTPREIPVTVVVTKVVNVEVPVTVVVTRVVTATPTPAPACCRQSNNDIILVFDSEPVGMNYHLHVTALSDTPIRDNVVDPLTWQSGIPEDNLQIVPTTMTTGWESIDADTWHFFLRPGVKFHNGEALTAANAVASLNFLGTDPENQPIGYTGGYGAEVAGDMTISINCDAACPIFPRTAIFSNIMPGGYFSSASESEKEQLAIGAGPYKQVDFSSTRLVYERYDDYVEVERANGEIHPEFQTAIIPEIRWLWRSERVTQAAMIAAGEADMAWDVGVDAADIAPAVKQGFAAETLNLKVMTLGCNWHPELCKVEVRQAIAMSINCQEMANAIYRGLTTCRGTNEFPGVTGTTIENTAPWEYDPDRAITLLAEANYDSDNLITLVARAFRVTKGPEIYEAISGYMAAVGISNQTVIQDRSLWLERSRCGSGRAVVEYMEEVLGLESPDPNFDQRVIDMGLTMNDVYAAGIARGSASFCVPGDLVTSTLSNELLDFQRTLLRNMDCGIRGSYFCDPSDSGAQSRIADAIATVDGPDRQAAMQYFADRLKNEAIIIGVFDLPIIYAINPRLQWEPRFDRRVRVNSMFYVD